MFTGIVSEYSVNLDKNEKLSNFTIPKHDQNPEMRHPSAQVIQVTLREPSLHQAFVLHLSQ